MRCFERWPIRARSGRAQPGSAVAVAVIGECRKTDVVFLRSDTWSDGSAKGKPL